MLYSYVAGGSQVKCESLALKMGAQLESGETHEPGAVGGGEWAGSVARAWQFGGKWDILRSGTALYHGHLSQHMVYFFDSWLLLR